MKNVKMTRNGDKLTIEVDLSKNFGPSRTGKTIIIASTEGNVKAPQSDDTFVGLNIYSKR